MTLVLSDLITLLRERGDMRNVIRFPRITSRGRPVMFERGPGDAA